MLKIHIAKLDNNRSYIIRNLKLSDDVYKILLDDKNRIFSNGLVEEIKSRPEKEQPGQFLNLITKCGPHAYDSFLNALWLTSQRELLFELEPRFSNKVQTVQALNIKMKTNEMKPGDILDKIGAPGNDPSRSGDAEVEDDTQNEIYSEKEIDEEEPMDENVTPLSTEQLVDVIKMRTEEESDIKWNAKRTPVCDSGRIFVLKSSSKFIDGCDYNLIGYLDDFFNNSGNCYCKLVQRRNELDDCLREISEQCYGLSCAMVLLVVKCKDGLVQFREFGSSCSEVVSKLIRSVDATRSIVMVTVYDCDLDVALLDVATIEAARRRKVVVVVCKMAEFDENKKNWMLYSAFECLKNISISGNSNFLQRICSSIEEVGSCSLERGLICGFEIFK